MRSTTTSLFRALFSTILLGLMFTSSVSAQEAVPGEYIVTYDELRISEFAEATPEIAQQSSSEIKLALAESLGAEIIGETNSGSAQLIRIPDGQQLQGSATLGMLSSTGGIKSIEPNYLYHTSRVPNDLSASLWGLHNTGQSGGVADIDIDAPEAWDTTTGSNNIVVGVVDSGIDYNHSDLRPNCWVNSGEIAGNGIDDDGNGYVDDIHGWNALNNNGDPMDSQSHGTHVAGTIGARGNNGQGSIVGVNWNVKIVGVKFIGSNGSGSTFSAINAIDYLVALKNRFDAGQPGGANVKVINASWGGTGFSSALQSAVSRANSAGILFVAAAGNSSNDNDNLAHYPSNFSTPNVISVAAADRRGRLASFSNYGATSVDLAAPGVSIVSTVPGSQYASFSGTSMAAPHVAGVAALVLAADSSLSPTQLKARLMNTAQTTGVNFAGKMVSPGLLNAKAALENTSPPPPPPAGSLPRRPTGLTSSVVTRPNGGTAGVITLNWNRPTTREDGTDLPANEIKDYLIYSSNGNGTSTSTAATVSNVQLNTTYTFQVSARDTLNNESAKSTTLSVRFNDADNDGSDDTNDQCPTDGSKVTPGVCGCGTPDIDTDGDGRLDCRETCDTDPQKFAPGSCGCGVADIDSDGDGTFDCNDACPTHIGKIEPGVCGCERPDRDSDNDGTLDCQDMCPADPTKTTPLSCGCGVPDTDANSDGSPDCIDLCPSNPDKKAPGLCGCDIPDTDRDGDGTPDCSDSCPTDPLKEEPLTCGCGVLETAGCVDLCPSDDSKMAPGVCGCGVSDDDSDFDGTANCNDACPFDTKKTEPGRCGCGSSDTNDDGTPVETCSPPDEDPTDGAGMDFNGDGLTDTVSVQTIESSNELMFRIQLANKSGESRYPLGDATDIPAIGDYNGDGLADLVSISRTEEGSLTWKIRDSRSGEVSSELHGKVGDRILSGGDLDGDGIDDPAVLSKRSVIALLSGTGKQRVKTRMRLPASVVTGSERFLDIDNDGKDELLVLQTKNAKSRRRKKNKKKNKLKTSKAKKVNGYLVAYDFRGKPVFSKRVKAGTSIVWTDTDGDETFELGYIKAKRDATQLVLFGKKGTKAIKTAIPETVVAVEGTRLSSSGKLVSGLLIQGSDNLLHSITGDTFAISAAGTLLEGETLLGATNSIASKR